MLVHHVAALLDRELRTLQREVESYSEDSQLWQAVPGMPNTAGTLVLHLAGNVRHFIGAVLGGTGYVRHRDMEFSRRDVRRTELLAEIVAARADLTRAFATIKDENLPAEYPEAITGMRVDSVEYLLHLLTHFAYHLGQLDTHRRLVTGNAASVGAVRPSELASARPA